MELENNNETWRNKKILRVVSQDFYKNKELLLLFSYIIINCIFYVFSVDNASFIDGADSGQYYGPALSLLQGEGFMINVGGDPLTFGTPLYSILLTIPIGLFGIESSTFGIIFLQCLMLYMTGRITRKFSVVFLKKESYLLHALIIFNPNSLITAHLVQTETLFTLLLVLSVFYLFKLIEKNCFKYVVILSISLGLMTLTRPAGLYILYTIPFLLISSIFMLNRLKIKEYIVNAVVILALSLTVLSPWVIRNYLVFDEVFVSSNSGTYLKDQYTQLLQVGRQLDEKTALENIDILQKKYQNNNPVNIICLQNERHWSCNDYLINSIMTGIKNEPVNNHIRALIESWGYLYLSGGASNIRNYLGFDGKEKIILFQKEKKNGLNGISNFISNLNPSYLLILVIVTSFAVLSRLLGLIGFLAMIQGDIKIRIHAIVIIILLIVFTAMYLYLGQSRFRVPLEPFLMIFTTFSLLIIKDKFLK